MSGTLLGSTFDLATLNPDGDAVPAAAQGNLRQLFTLLAQVRDIVGAPLLVTSGYRDPARNTEVGGVPKSQHLDGSAADVIVQGVELPEVARRIDAAIRAGKLATGQVVYYPTELAPGVNKGHVHVSLPNGNSRNRQLIHLAGGKYIDLNPANWPAFTQVGVGVGVLLLIVLAVLMLGGD